MHHSLPLPRSYRDDTHNGSGGGLVEQPKEGETAPKLSVPAGAQTVNGAVAAQALRDLRQHLSSEVERLFLVRNSNHPSISHPVARSLARTEHEREALLYFCWC